MSSKPLRTLIVSHGHPSLALGGAEIASYNLHRGLSRFDGVESHYLARVGPPVPRHGATALMSLRQQDRELLYYADDYEHFMMSNHNTDEIERDFVRVLRDIAPDVVHFHHFLGLGLETLYAVREVLPEALLVVTFHEYLAICHHHGQMVKTGSNKLCDRASPTDCHACFPEIAPARFLARESFARTLLNLADHFVSPSAFLVDRYRQWGLDANRFSVIENGLDIAEAAPPRTFTDAEERRSRFAFFGQLTPYKGADVLIDAVTRIPEQIWGDATLLIYGGNLERQPESYQETFRKLVERADGRVRFCGSYRNSDMPRLMRSIDWVVVPSVWWENSPIVIQEALFHGRPLIVSNIGGMAEKVADGINGLHFRAGSPEDLADRLIEALRDRALWDRLRLGIGRPPTFEECAQQHLDLYRQLRAERSSSTEATARDPALSA